MYCVRILTNDQKPISTIIKIEDLSSLANILDHSKSCLKYSVIDINGGKELTENMFGFGKFDKWVLQLFNQK